MVISLRDFIKALVSEPRSPMASRQRRAATKCPLTQRSHELEGSRAVPVPGTSLTPSLFVCRWIEIQREEVVYLLRFCFVLIITGKVRLF